MPSQSITEGLSVLCVNARSLRNKFSEFVSHLSVSRAKFSFLIVTETWLKSNNDFAYEIDGYNSSAVYRADNVGSGGGIKIYYLNSINVEVVNNFSGCFETYESLLISTTVPKLGKLFLCGIYRMPNGSISSEFVSGMTGILSEIGVNRSLIGGDFNLNTQLSPMARHVSDYTQLLGSFGYENLIDNLTYVSPITGSETSCLDHLWCNFASDSDQGLVIRPGISDHYPICFITKTHIQCPSTIKFRNLCNANVERFKNRISEEFSSLDLSGSSDVDQYSNNLTSFLMKLTNRYFPILTKQVNNKKKKSPWVKNDVVRCIRKKYVWYKLLLRGRITKNSYNRYCRALRNLLLIAEEEYYRKRLASLNRDKKRTGKF